MNTLSVGSNSSLDRANLAQNKQILDNFEPGEKILLSTLIIKVNQVNKKQERIFAITNKAIYNIVPSNENMFMQFLGKLLPIQKIKRRIKLTSVYGVTVSSIGSEFVIHVPVEYDYRFQSADFRKQIIEVLIEAYYKTNLKKMPFFIKEDFTLVAATTTENDVKKGISRMPTEAPICMNLEDFKVWSSQKNKSEIIYPQHKKNPTNQAIAIEDFDLIKVLGRGAFGKVMMCEKRDTKELYAIKSLRKEHILDKNQVEHTRTERKLLEMIDNTFLVSLEFAFQTSEKLFFVMKFMRGGELFKHLRDKRRFPESTARFYGASIVLALEYLHKLNVVYRDLKPENILMNEDGYVKLTDFGLAKFLTPGVMTYSFVGTPEYLAPEIIRQQGHSFEADWWSLGILIYEMVVGRPPFFSQNQHQLFRAIMEQELVFPSQLALSTELKDLVTMLLKKNPTQRLGHKVDAEAIKSHAWFKDFKFSDLEDKKLIAPIMPKLLDKLDVQNFDQEFTREEPVNSFVNMDSKQIQQFKDEFGAVTYMGGNLNE